ncbi:MAG: 3-phosphoshikimate 1-carboxyvinyltransferase [Alphaproteobacteria bacterium]
MPDPIHKNNPTPAKLIAYPAKYLRANISINLPGDKSISHRALICAALAYGTSHIHGLLEADDIFATARAISNLGAQCHQQKNGAWIVNGRGAWQSPTQPLNLANSGTGARLLLGAIAGQNIHATITGDKSLSNRPMKRVLTPLTKMGAQFHARNNDYLPIHVKGQRRLLPIEWHMQQASAQVKSAILLAALAAPGQTLIREPKPSRDHSERILPLFGAKLSVSKTNPDNPNSERTISITGENNLHPAEIYVPADPSAAAFIIVAHLLAGEGDLLLKNVGVNPHRIGLLTTLQKMGANLKLNTTAKNNPKNNNTTAKEPVADILVQPAMHPLESLKVEAQTAPSMIDEYPILAVAAATARGTTHLEGLAELRHKESDRFNAILNLLNAAGVRAKQSGDDAIEIQGCGAPPEGGCHINAKGDHRIAMSALVLGLACRRPIEVSGAELISTSFPDFTRTLSALGARIETIS